MIMQSDLRDVYHGVHITGFHPIEIKDDGGDKFQGVMNDFYVQVIMSLNHWIIIIIIFCLSLILESCGIVDKNMYNYRKSVKYAVEIDAKSTSVVYLQKKLR